MKCVVLRMFAALTCCILVLACSQASAQTLKQQLYDINAMRAGDKTPFASVEKKAEELLQKYSLPEEQSHIYYTIALVYAQSGQIHPQKTIDFSRKALALPLDPTKQLELYTYWGDAVQIMFSGSRDLDLARARSQALQPYLAGLKATLAFDLPRTAPDLPIVKKSRVMGSSDPEELKKSRRDSEQQMAAWNLAILQQDLIQYREIMLNQITYMYSRFPFATDELEHSAVEALGDSWLVDELLSRTKAEIKQRVDKSFKPDAHLDVSRPHSCLHFDV